MARNKSPVVRMMPVLPVVSNGFAVTRFSIPAYDPEGEALTFTFASREQYGGLVGNFTNVALGAELAAITTVGNDFGGNNTHDNMPDTPSFMSWQNAATGSINWRTSSLDDGMYNLAVQVSDGASYVTAQFGVYLFSFSPSFCHRQCETDLPPSVTERMGTVADPDGVYDTCNVCKGTDTLDSDYSFCTPVRNSEFCAGTPALASPPPPSPSPPIAPGVEASASPTASPEVPDTATPTPGIEAAPGAGRHHLLQEAASLVPTADACLTSGGTLKFMYPTPGFNEDNERADSELHEERVERGVGFEFTVTVFDDDVCAEQRVEAMGMPAGASLTVSEEAAVDEYGVAGYVMHAGNKSTTYTFAYPSFTANPLNDNRPDSQLVCFYASDKYMAEKHCVKLIVNPLERRDEQVLVRFGCYTGLLWNPKPANWAEVPKPWGKFCFFDNMTDLSNTEHIATYCSASSYESQQWHHATVTLDGAGGGKLLVDGHVESEFTTGGTTVDCSPPVVRRSRRLQSLAPSDGEAAAADAASSSSSRALLSDHGGEDPDPPVACACSARVAQACEVKYVGFRGLVDEVAIFPAALSVEQIKTKMFGMASGLPTPRQGLGQATPVDYAEGALAYYKFDTPCAAPTADAIEPTPLADSSEVVAYYGREQYGLVDSSTNGTYGGSAFSPYGGDTFVYAAAPWNAPVVVKAMGPGNATDETMTQLPTDASPARVSVVGAAPSPFLTCTADPGPMFGTEATPGIMRVGVGSQHVTQWRAAPATVLTAGVVDVGLGAGAYWGATEIMCDVSSSTVGAALHVGVSNDGGLSRGLAAAVTVGEMALQLDGSGWVDVSQILTGEEMNVQYTVGAWVLPSCENTAPVYAMAFARDNSITSGMMYDVAAGGFDGVWQGQPVTGGPFAAACDEWHFITIVSQATSNFDARGGGATNGYFYVDGVSQGWSVVGGTTRAMDDSLYVGGSAFGQAGTKMKGWVDDVRVYTSALTPTEVAELMWTEPLNLLAGSLTPSLVGYYRFSDGSGTVVKDVAGVVTISATVRGDAGFPISSAFVPKAAPWEPTLTTSASAVVGGLGGGETITVHGSGFAASPFMMCVWGALEEGDELTLPECAPGVDCSEEAGLRRPDGVASPLVVTAAATVIDGVTSPATWVSETEVTCTTPPMSATGGYRLAVTNKPNGQPHAISSSVVFQVKETVLELDCMDSHVDVSAIVADAALASYTVAVWAKPSASGNDPLATVWSFQGVDGEGDLAMMAYAASKGFFYFDDNILDGRAGAAAADQWHHLVVTMTAAGRGQLLVNDAPAVTFSTTSRAVAGGKFLVGAHLVDGAAADMFCGQLDELLVLGDALSPTAAAAWAATLQLDLSSLSVITYLRFNEPADATSAIAEEGSSRGADAPVVGGVTRVYTQTPALPATVLSVSPATAPVAYTGEVVISGGNFANSPYTTCTLGDDVVACEINEDGTEATVAASTAAPVAGPLPVGLNYGSVADSFAVMERVVTSGDVRVGLSAFISSFAPEATTLPGRLATPNTAAPFSPETPLTIVVQDGDAVMGGGPMGGPGGGGPMASRHLLSAERRQLAGHEDMTTVAAWIKLDATQPEAAGLSGRDLGLLGVGSWRLYALVHPAMTLYSATGEETDPVRATVYGALLTELQASGTLGTSGYSGAVDDVWRWDRALSAAEVSGLFRFGHFALDFYATPATVTVPLPESLADSTALTAKLWVRSEEVEGLQAIVAVPAKDTPLFSAVWFGAVNGRPAVAIRTPCEVEPCSSVWETSSAFAVVQEGVWVHLTYTVDTEADTVTVLADGLPVLTATLPSDLELLDLADDLLLGSNPVDSAGVSAYTGGGAARTFKGSIFDLKLMGAYDMAATDAACTQPSGDVAAYYPLNDGYGPPTELSTGARGTISHLEAWVKATDMAPEDGSRFHHFDLTGSFATPVGTVGCLTVSALDKCNAQLMDGELTAADVVVGVDSMGLSPSVELLPMGADGTTTVCYTSDTCGRYSLSLLGGEYEGEIAVIPGAVVPADSTYSQVSGSPGIEESCEATNSFVVVTLKDANGCTASGFDAPLVGMVYGPQDKLEIAATPTEEEGVYRIEYVPEAAGTYFVEAWHAGELVGGAGVTATHCSGRSVFLDGFSAVEVDEAEGSDALDLADTPLTLMAWVKRGPEGDAPAPPAPPPAPPPGICPGGEPDGSCVPAKHRRHLLQDPLQIANGDDELRYVFFKGGWEQHPDEDSQRQQLGSDIKGYYLGFTADYSTIEGGVYVAGQGINNAGEYRAVQSTRQLDPALELVDCDTGAPACTRNNDNGWVHVAMTYDGTSLKLFTNGVVNGQQSWPDAKFGRPNDYYHPLSIGLGFAGQVDEVRIYSEAVDFTGETRLYCPVKMSPAPNSLVAYMPFNEGRGDATAVFSATSTAFGSFAPPPGEEAPRAGWATKPRPDSLPNQPSPRLRPDPAFSTAIDATPDARYLASDDYTTAILLVTVRDSCDFVHPTTSADLTATAEPLAYVHDGLEHLAGHDALFAATVGAGASQTMPARVVSTAVGDKWGPHALQLSTTLAGVYGITVGLEGGGALALTQPLQAGVRVVAAAADATTSELLGAMRYDTLVGVPSSVTVQAKDAFGNEAQVGGEVWEATSSAGVHVTGVTDYGDGKYEVAFVASAPSAQRASVTLVVNGGEQNSGSLPVDGASTSGLPVKMFGLSDDEGVPGRRVEHAATAVGSDLYVFGGVDGAEKTYNAQLWKGAFAGPYTYGTRTATVAAATEAPGDSDRIGHLTKLTVDTTDSHINADCSDLRLTDAAGTKLSFWIDPTPGCKATDTVLYVNGLTGEGDYHLFYWAPSAPTASDGAATFDVFHDFEGPLPTPEETTECAQPAPEGLFAPVAAHTPSGHSALYVNPTVGGHGDLTIDVSGAMSGVDGANYYLRAYFYDSGADDAANLLVLQGADCGDRLQVGVQAAWSGGSFYVARANGEDTYGFPAAEAETDGGATPKVTRSVGWHLIEMWDDGAAGGSAVLAMDGTYVSLPVARDTSRYWRVTPSSVILRSGVLGGAGNAAPALWDAVAFSAGAGYGVGGATLGTPATIVWASNGGWEAMSPAGRPPPARMAGTLTATLNANESSVVLVSGERSGFAFNDVWAYHPTEDRWSWTDPLSVPGRMPAPRFDHSTVSVGDKVYVFGGRATGSGLAFGDVWMYNTATAEWYDVTPASQPPGSVGRPPALWGHSAVEVDGKMLVFGGYDAAGNACVSDVWEFDLHLQRWAKHSLASTVAPRARYGHTAVAYDGKMNVLGGASESFEQFPTWWQYDPRAKLWVQVGAGTDVGDVEGFYSHSASFVGDGGFQAGMLLFGGQGNGGYKADLKLYPLYKV